MRKTSRYVKTETTSEKQKGKQNLLEVSSLLCKYIIHFCIDATSLMWIFISYTALNPIRKNYCNDLEYQEIDLRQFLCTWEMVKKVIKYFNPNK